MGGGRQVQIQRQFRCPTEFVEPDGWRCEVEICLFRLRSPDDARGGFNTLQDKGAVGGHRQRIGVQNRLAHLSLQLHCGRGSRGFAGTQLPDPALQHTCAGPKRRGPVGCQGQGLQVPLDQPEFLRRRDRMLLLAQACRHRLRPGLVVGGQGQGLPVPVSERCGHRCPETGAVVKLIRTGGEVPNPRHHVPDLCIRHLVAPRGHEVLDASIPGGPEPVGGAAQGNPFRIGQTGRGQILFDHDGAVPGAGRSVARSAVLEKGGLSGRGPTPVGHGLLGLDRDGGPSQPQQHDQGSKPATQGMSGRTRAGRRHCRSRTVRFSAG